MIRFLRDVDPAMLRARAGELDARAVIVGGELGAVSVHLLRWLLFAPCRIFVLGASREQLFERLTLAAHAYDTPLDVRRAEDKLELAESLESARARLSGARADAQGVVHYQFVHAESSLASEAAAATSDAGDDPPLRRYLVVLTDGTRDPALFSPTAGGARVELPLLLPPSSTRRSPEPDWRAPVRITGAARVLPVDAAVLHLLEVASGGTGSAEPSLVPGAPDPVSQGELATLAAEDVEIYERGLALRGAAQGGCVREEVETSRGVFLITRAAGERAGRLPLILVNAYGVPSEVFEPLIRAASERYFPLTHQSRAIPAFTRERNDTLLEREVEDLVVVLEKFAEDGCILLGWCNGAPLALEAALRRPALVRRLVLLSGVYPSVGVPQTDYHRKLAQLLPTLSRSETACGLYAKALYGSERANVEQRPSTPEQARLNHLLNRAFRTQTALFRYANYYVQFWNDRSLGAARGPDRDAASALHDRVRFIVAPEDDIGPADASHVLAAELGAGEPRIAPGGGHYLLFDDPRRLLELIDA